MIICSVCEHPQVQGAECEQCGFALGHARPSSAPIAPLEGLERTAMAPVAEKDIALRPLEALEGTRASPVIAPTEVLAELERNSLGRVEVEVEVMADLDLGRAPPAPRTQLSEVTPACRYCKHVQAAGAFCDRCGMRRALIRSGGAQSPSKKPIGELLLVRCRPCGAVGPSGQICRECGRPLPVAEG